MPFCNSCGSDIEVNAKFCPKCGKPSGSGTTAAATPMAPPPAQSSNAVKVILIVVAAIIVVGVIGAISATVIGLHIARNTHVEERDGKVKVQTPFGTVETSENADEASKNLGVAVYPGARATKGNSANVNVGGMHTTSVQLETDDPPEKVAEFYRSQLPNANVNTGEGDHYTIVSTQNHNMITVNIEGEDGKTRIAIASVSGKGVGQGGAAD
jgi:flagellar basal body-associated protein FliL